MLLPLMIIDNSSGGGDEGGNSLGVGFNAFDINISGVSRFTFLEHLAIFWE